jgi:hypothetical protein
MPSTRLPWLCISQLEMWTLWHADLCHTLKRKLEAECRRHESRVEMWDAVAVFIGVTRDVVRRIEALTVPTTPEESLKTAADLYRIVNEWLQLVNYINSELCYIAKAYATSVLYIKILHRMLDVLPRVLFQVVSVSTFDSMHNTVAAASSSSSSSKPGDKDAKGDFDPQTDDGGGDNVVRTHASVE